MTAPIPRENWAQRHLQLLQDAIAAHQAGRLDEAQRVYLQILQEDDAHVDAHHNLGVLLRQRGEILAALPHFRQALERFPSQSQYWISYIDCAGEKIQ